MTVRQRDWPDAMTTPRPTTPSAAKTCAPASTCSSEIPERVGARRSTSCSGWRRSRTRPSGRCCGRRSSARGRPSPIPTRERLHAYAEKAMREAGDLATWTEPDADYEKAVHCAVDAAFDDEQVRRVLDGLLATWWNRAGCNGLAAKLIAAGRARRARRLPGQRAVGAEPRRPGQPPTRGLRPAASCSARRPGRATASMRLAAPSCCVVRSGPEPAPRPARAVLGYTADRPDRGGRRPRGGVRPRRRDRRGDAAARRPGERRRLGRHLVECRAARRSSTC